MDIAAVATQNSSWSEPQTPQLNGAAGASGFLSLIGSLLDGNASLSAGTAGESSTGGSPKSHQPPGGKQDAEPDDKGDTVASAKPLPATVSVPIIILPPNHQTLLPGVGFTALAAPAGLRIYPARTAAVPSDVPAAAGNITTETAPVLTSDILIVRAPDEWPADATARLGLDLFRRWSETTPAPDRAMVTASGQPQPLTARPAQLQTPDLPPAPPVSNDPVVTSEGVGSLLPPVTVLAVESVLRSASADPAAPVRLRTSSPILDSMPSEPAAKAPDSPAIVEAHPNRQVVLPHFGFAPPAFTDVSGTATAPASTGTSAASTYSEPATAEFNLPWTPPPLRQKTPEPRPPGPNGNLAFELLLRSRASTVVPDAAPMAADRPLSASPTLPVAIPLPEAPPVQAAPPASPRAEVAPIHVSPVPAIATAASPLSAAVPAKPPAPDPSSSIAPNAQAPNAPASPAQASPNALPAVQPGTAATPDKGNGEQKDNPEAARAASPPIAAAAAHESTPSADRFRELARPLSGQALTPSNAPSEPAAPARPASAEPVRNISILLPDSSEGRVHVQLSERAGQVHVDVRASNPEVAHTLRGNVDDLISRLEARGYQAATFSPVTGITRSSAAESAGQQLYQDQPRDTAQGGAGNQREQAQHPGQHDQQRRRPYDFWSDYLDGKLQNNRPAAPRS